MFHSRGEQENALDFRLIDTLFATFVTFCSRLPSNLASSAWSGVLRSTLAEELGGVAEGALRGAVAEHAGEFRDPFLAPAVKR